MDYTSDEEEWADFLGELWLGSGKSRRISRTCHHDALKFPDGQIALLTRLSPGQQATVLQLPAAPRTAEERGAEARCCRRLIEFGERERGQRNRAIAELKRKPQQDDGARDKRERRQQENALDEVLKDTFPASDPVSMSSRHRPPPTATGQRPEGRCGESHRVARNGDAEGSPGAATCLRIGLEPTGSASGDAVSPTPVPTASA